MIVCGGGPAGVGAAVSAARQGRKVLLLEQYGSLGGMWTAGLVNPLFDQENKGGLVWELTKRLKTEEAFGAFWNICFDYETMKLLLDELCEEASVDVLLHTYFSRPIMEGNRVTGVVVENKSGRQAYLGKIIIDCTGDGDVAARAGASFWVGRDSDHAVQPMTMMFLLGNVDYWQDKENELYDLMKEALLKDEHGYQITFTSPYIIRLPKGRYAVVQLTHLRDHSGIDARSLSDAERIGRRQVMEVYRFFKRSVPELSNVDLVATAAQIGVRESRRIQGEYTVTVQDVGEGRKFTDGIVNVSFGIDIHEPGKLHQTCLPVKNYQIPYRSLIPKGIEGLLVAGRCISGAYEAHASYRVTGDCMAMGEAAGLAASEAARNQNNVRDVDGALLKRALGIADRENGEGNRDE